MGAALVAGCSLFSGDEESGDNAETLSEEELAPTRGVPIEAVRDIEIGRTRDGFAVTAFGTAPALGYSQPRLRARRDGRPGPDGFLDFDFVATPPQIGLERGAGRPEARSIRADALIPRSDLANVSGIRVHTLSGGLQVAF